MNETILFNHCVLSIETHIKIKITILNRYFQMRNQVYLNYTLVLYTLHIVVAHDNVLSPKDKRHWCTTSVAYL